MQHTTTLVEIVAIRMQGARRRANGLHCFACALTHWRLCFQLANVMTSRCWHSWEASSTALCRRAAATWRRPERNEHTVDWLTAEEMASQRHLNQPQRADEDTPKKAIRRFYLISTSILSWCADCFTTKHSANCLKIVNFERHGCCDGGSRSCRRQSNNITMSAMRRRQVSNRSNTQRYRTKLNTFYGNSLSNIVWVDKKRYGDRINILGVTPKLAETATSRQPTTQETERLPQKQRPLFSMLIH